MKIANLMKKVEYIIVCVDFFCRFLTFKNGKSDVYSVAVKNSCKAFGNYASRTAGFDNKRCVFS